MERVVKYILIAVVIIVVIVIIAAAGFAIATAGVVFDLGGLSSGVGVKIRTEANTYLAVLPSGLLTTNASGTTFTLKSAKGGKLTTGELLTIGDAATDAYLGAAAGTGASCAAQTSSSPTSWEFRAVSDPTKGGARISSGKAYTLHPEHAACGSGDSLYNDLTIASKDLSGREWSLVEVV